MASRHGETRILTCRLHSAGDRQASRIGATFETDNRPIFICLTDILRKLELALKAVEHDFKSVDCLQQSRQLCWVDLLDPPRLLRQQPHFLIRRNIDQQLPQLVARKFPRRAACLHRRVIPRRHPARSVVPIRRDVCVVAKKREIQRRAIRSRAGGIAFRQMKPHAAKTAVIENNRRVGKMNPSLYRQRHCCERALADEIAQYRDVVFHKSARPIHQSPSVSGRPSMILRFCTAAPPAPLPRLSSTATRRACCVLPLPKTNSVMSLRSFTSSASTVFSAALSAGLATFTRAALS